MKITETTQEEFDKAGGDNKTFLSLFHNEKSLCEIMVYQFSNTIQEAIEVLQMLPPISNQYGFKIQTEDKTLYVIKYDYKPLIPFEIGS